jgi:hypothetical protein
MRGGFSFLRVLVCRNDSGSALCAQKGASGCQSCIEFDKQIEKYRLLLVSASDPAEIDRMKQVIGELYADRVRLYRTPKSRSRAGTFVRCNFSPWLRARTGPFQPFAARV